MTRDMLLEKLASEYVTANIVGGSTAQVFWEKLRRFRITQRELVAIRRMARDAY